jgi:hypothetical protein
VILLGVILSIESVCQAAKQRLCRWTRPDNHGPVLDAALDLTCTNSQLLLENMLLRWQLIVLKRQAKRPALSWRDRTLLVPFASRLRIWGRAMAILQPETVLRRHRTYSVGYGDASRDYEGVANYH